MLAREPRSLSGFAPETIAVCGMLRDKDIGGVLRALAPRVTRWHLASLPGPRGALAPRTRGASRTEKERAASIRLRQPSPRREARAGEGDKIVVFGSFLTVGEVMAWLKQQQDVETLKRRGRRRLVGAVALVLLAVIVLPMVFDPEPRAAAPPVSVRIPGEDDAPFKPKPPPQKPAPTGEEGCRRRRVRRPDRRVRDARTTSPPSSPRRSSALHRAVAGNLTRVRAGPFATREAAEQARDEAEGPGPRARRGHRQVG